MILSDLRSLCANKLDYDPTVERYQREVDRLLNEAEQRLGTEAAWPHLQREVRLLARADMTATDGVVTSSSTTVTTTAAFFTTDMRDEGAELVGPDGVSYEILRYVSSTQVTLATAYQGATVNPATIRVVWRTLRLPEDCLSILQVGQRPLVATATSPTNEPWFPLMKREDEQLGLDLDEVGLPQAWVPASDAVIRSPVKAPTLTTAAGTWLAGTYEFAYLFERRGLRSTLSPSASITLTAIQSPTITVPDTTLASGTIKAVFVRPTSTNTSLAPLRAYRIYGATIVETTTTVNLGTPLTDAISMAARAPEHGGRYRRIRLHPRPSEDTEVTIRFVQRAPLLLEDQDEPLLPAEHHGYLTSSALVDLYLKHDQLPHSRLEQNRADAVLKQMRGRYLTPESRHLVKGGFDAGLNRAGLRRDRTITWSG